MDVFTQSSVMVGKGDDGDLPSLVEGVRSGRPAAVERLVARVKDRVRGWLRGSPMTRTPRTTSHRKS